MGYTAPTGDIMFTLRRIAGFDELAGMGLFGDLDADTVAAILEEAGRFAAEQLAPLNMAGDIRGARLEDGRVTMPDGWREVYARWVEAGWGSLAAPEAQGGQGLPLMVSMAVGEIWQSACMAFALNPLLTQGAAEALAAHGSDDLKQRYLPKLTNCEWSGTMQLTEPQAGSDLRFIKTRAEPREDGSYRLFGAKIFITYGEHDLAENIVHMVLARIPGSPEGTGGLSLFLVPKYIVESDGSIGDRNDIHAVSLEHKLGIHASPTCVMQMGEGGGAAGWLVGERNRGLAAMFLMMNRARLAIGVQGAGIAERAFQQALAYAKERRQGAGADGADHEMVPIIRHADVKRMLMTMKANTAAARAVCLVTARELDLAERSRDAAARRAALARASLFTPVAKAWASDLGVEVASTGIQVHGGMGYIEETGAAQHYRDARIAPIYEGTNGIQAIDLVTRKLPMQGGAVARAHITELKAIVAEVQACNEPGFGKTGLRLDDAVAALEEATAWMLSALAEDTAAALAGAAPYLKLFGVVSGGAWLARGALAQTRMQGEQEETGRNAIRTARYFAETQATQARGLAQTIMDGGAMLADMPEAAIGG